MATRSSIPAWEIPWIEESGGLQSMRLRKRYDLGAEQQQKQTTYSNQYNPLPGHPVLHAHLPGIRLLVLRHQ